MATKESARPIVSLMTHVASDLAYLVQTEFRLARAELREKTSAPGELSTRHGSPLRKRQQMRGRPT
jgi:hypothetical protein